MKHDGQKNNEKKSLNLTLNSVALGVAVYGARASLYSQQNSIQAMQQAPAVKNTARAPVCMTGPACRSMQRHGQPTALSQLFPFAPSKRE